MRWLNFVGLVLGIIVVVIIFVWGPPQPSFQEYTPISVEESTPLSSGKTAGEEAKDAARQKKLYDRMSKAGLGFILAGFVLQAIASFPRGT